jgi:hypothetical protein
MARKTDIVVITRGRLEYLQKTLEYIVKRTHSPYRLFVIDDGSRAKDGNVEYLLRLWQKGRLEGLFLRHTCGGLRANINAGFWMSFSDPVLITDDDVLCPDLEPDWLSRCLHVMAGRKDIGILGPNDPAGNRLRKDGARKAYKVEGPITLCKVLPGRLTLIRRAVLNGWNLPHKEGQLVNAGTYPRSQLSQHCLRSGYKMGYVTDVYCQHIGHKCARPEKPVEENMLSDVDPRTLKPRNPKWAW